MYRKYLTLVILLISQFAHTQVAPVEIVQMSDIISEPSGIAVIYNKSNGQFEYWMNNDYNYPDSIFSFRLDNMEEPTRVLDIEQDYYDWEDMTKDEEDNLYLGDFGNWTPQTALQIIKVPNPNEYNTASPPSTEAIRYEYPFVGVADTEAMFYHKGFLYLLSKTVNPNLNPSLNEDYSYLFRIPAVSNVGATKHVAELVDSLLVVLPGDPVDASEKITGADMSLDGKQLVLLGYEGIWMFSCFEDNDFFGGTGTHFDMDFRQYEGIAFLNNHEVIISKEGSNSDPNYNPILYYLDLSPHLSSGCIDCEKVINGQFDEAELAWTLFTADGGTAQVDLDMNGGRAALNVNQLSSSQWHANLRHKGIVLSEGKTYKLSYSAYSDQPATISIIINKADGSQGYFYSQAELTAQSSVFTHEFTMDEESDYNSYLSFNVGNSALTTIYLDDVSLVGECAQLTVSDKILSEESKSLRVFPNPVSDVLEITYSGWGNDTEVELYDGSGVFIASYKSQKMAIGNLRCGIYFLLLKEKGIVKNIRKFFKI